MFIIKYNIKLKGNTESYLKNLHSHQIEIQGCLCTTCPVHSQYNCLIIYYYKQLDTLLENLGQLNLEKI